MKRQSLDLNKNYLYLFLAIDKVAFNVSESYLAKKSTLSLLWQDNHFFRPCANSTSTFKKDRISVASYPQIVSNKLYLPSQHINELKLMNVPGAKIKGESWKNNFCETDRQTPTFFLDDKIINRYIPSFACCLASCCSSFSIGKKISPTMPIKSSAFFKKAKKQNHPIVFFSMNSYHLLSYEEGIPQSELDALGEECVLRKDLFYRLFKNHDRIYLCYTISTDSKRKRKIIVTEKH